MEKIRGLTAKFVYLFGEKYLPTGEWQGYFWISESGVLDRSSGLSAPHSAAAMELELHGYI